MYMSATPAASLARSMGVSDRTIRRMVASALRAAAAYHGLEPPASLVDLEGSWFYRVASML
jgi:hypothetical protein